MPAYAGSPTVHATLLVECDALGGAQSGRKYRFCVTGGQDIARDVERLHCPSVIVTFAAWWTRACIGNCATFHDVSRICYG